MSVVLARKTNKEIQIASDSYSEIGSYYSVNDSVKLFDYKKLNIAIGFVGRVDAKYSFNQFLLKYAITEVGSDYRGIFELMVTYRKFIEKSRLGSTFKSEALIATSKGIFFYDFEDYELIEIPEFYAIGAGHTEGMVLINEGYELPQAIVAISKVNKYVNSNIKHIKIQRDDY